MQHERSDYHQRPSTLRRVDKIDGEQVEGLSSLKLMVNKLKDSLIPEDAADAQRQTQDARRGTIMKLLSGDDWFASRGR